MVESRFVSNGFMAGVGAGVVSLVLQLALLKEGREAGVKSLPEPLAESVLRMLENPLFLALVVAPVTLLVMGVLGLLMGWLQEALYHRIRALGGRALVASALTASLFMALLLVAPNLALGTHEKALVNGTSSLAYAVLLLVLTLWRDPRRGGGGSLPRY